ncbi:twin-arginine translocase TatA/TatE family subunit [Melittangium boletus]|uniref:Sec-independent protein translocase protein TatA n=1 Tax=Melittangium boletus DSM 14713 TaxID=1294270 RepID=A0A250I6N3_9BACT|nr:twin-arginine translocase TatA/TatE family subunit [Melittangium boletus]ATB26821.1 primosome subunit DnaD [Melittangium boletus DSM 14713]
MGLKPMEIVLIMGVLLLLFGGSRLPQLGSSLGSAIRNFKRSFSTEDAPADEKKPVATLANGGGVDKDVSARSTTQQS